ncbi:hypothetical protein ACFLY7_00765 [Patescibacteria group bacterium]
MSKKITWKNYFRKAEEMEKGSLDRMLVLLYKPSDYERGFVGYTALMILHKLKWVICDIFNNSGVSIGESSLETNDCVYKKGLASN